MSDKFNYTNPAEVLDFFYTVRPLIIKDLSDRLERQLNELLIRDVEVNKQVFKAAVRRLQALSTKEWKLTDEEIRLAFQEAYSEVVSLDDKSRRLDT